MQRWMNVVMVAWATLLAGCAYTQDSFPDGLKQGDITGVLVGVLPGQSGEAAPLLDGVGRVTVKGSSIISRSRAADGRFTVRNLPVGKHQLGFQVDTNLDGQPDLAATIQVPIRVPDLGVARSKVDMGRVLVVAPGSVGGTVELEGLPFPHPGYANVFITAADSSQRTRVEAGTNHFTLGGLGAGTWRITAVWKNRLSASVEVVVESGKTAQLDAALVLKEEVGTGTFGGRLIPPGEEVDTSLPGLFKLASQTAQPLDLGDADACRFKMVPVDPSLAPTCVVPCVSDASDADIPLFNGLITMKGAKRAAYLFPGQTLPSGACGRSSRPGLAPGIYTAQLDLDATVVKTRLENIVIRAGQHADLPDVLAVLHPDGCVDLDQDGACAQDFKVSSPCWDTCRSSSQPACQDGTTTVDCDDDGDGQPDAEEVFGLLDSPNLPPGALPGPCLCSDDAQLPNDGAHASCEGDPTRSDRDHDGVCDVFDAFPNCALNRSPCTPAGTGLDGHPDVFIPARMMNALPGTRPPAVAHVMAMRNNTLGVVASVSSPVLLSGACGQVAPNALPDGTILGTTWLFASFQRDGNCVGKRRLASDGQVLLRQAAVDAQDRQVVVAAGSRQFTVDGVAFGANGGSGPSLLRLEPDTLVPPVVKSITAEPSFSLFSMDVPAMLMAGPLDDVVLLISFTNVAATRVLLDSLELAPSLAGSGVMVVALSNDLSTLRWTRVVQNVDAALPAVDGVLLSRLGNNSQAVLLAGRLHGAVTVVERSGTKVVQTQGGNAFQLAMPLDGALPSTAVTNSLPILGNPSGLPGALDGAVIAAAAQDGTSAHAWAVQVKMPQDLGQVDLPVTTLGPPVTLHPFQTLVSESFQAGQWSATRSLHGGPVSADTGFATSAVELDAAGNTVVAGVFERTLAAAAWTLARPEVSLVEAQNPASPQGFLLSITTAGVGGALASPQGNGSALVAGITRVSTGHAVYGAFMGDVDFGQGLGCQNSARLRGTRLSGPRDIFTPFIWFVDQDALAPDPLCAPAVVDAVQDDAGGRMAPRDAGSMASWSAPELEFLDVARFGDEDCVRFTSPDVCVSVHAVADSASGEGCNVDTELRLALEGSTNVQVAYDSGTGLCAELTSPPLPRLASHVLCVAGFAGQAVGAVKLSLESVPANGCE